MLANASLEVRRPIRCHGLDPENLILFQAILRTPSHDLAVLFLCYEDMKQDLPLTVQRIAKFIGCALDDELLDIVVRQSSIEFIRVHQRQFDDHLMRDARDAVCGLPPGRVSYKVRTGNVGDHTQELPQEILEALDRRWHDEIAIPLGFPSYDAFRAALSR